MTLIDRAEAANLTSAAHAGWSGEDTGTVSWQRGVSQQLTTLAGELEALLRLPHDWDSYGGLPTTTEAARAAIFALADAGWDGVLPTVAPMADGGVTLEWGGDDDGVELTFSPTGSVTGVVDSNGFAYELVAESPADPSVHEALAWADKLV